MGGKKSIKGNILPNKKTNLIYENERVKVSNPWIFWRLLIVLWVGEYKTYCFA